MNDPALAVATRTPLLRLVDEHFGEAELTALLGQLPASLPAEIWQDALRRPVSDFLTRPGKQFRANLVRTSYRLAGGREQCPELLPLIVEVLHAGSLIIDDIQDKSAWRRGQAALHCEYGLPVALNVGNWMYFWAFALVDKLELEPRVQLSLYRWMSRVLLACHHGQGLDLTVSMKDLPQARVLHVVDASTQLKTGALMELAAVLGAVAAEASTQTVASLGQFGRRLGVALQMLDDLSGLTTEKRGHKGHEDLLEGRPTWPWAWLADELPLGQYERFRTMAREVITREQHPRELSLAMCRRLSGSGRLRIHRSLQVAFAELRDAVGSSATLRTLRQEIQRLEKSYA